LHAAFNLIEAVFWIILAIVLAWHSWSSRASTKRLGMIAALALAAFAVSDIVEIQTGAWYRPLWLLAWKAACLIILAACYVRYRQTRPTEYSEHE
jgi:hypothetical protein